MAATIITQFKAQRPRAMRQQITEHVRDLICSGQLDAGSRLPSTQALAAQWESHAATVHAALTPLVKEGLLERKPRAGTFVKAKETRLQTIGVYSGIEAMSGVEAGFCPALFASVHRHCNARQIAMTGFLDSRPNMRDTTLPELERAAANRSIQGLVVLVAGFPGIRWLEKLPIPVAYVSSANLPNSVTHDIAEAAETSLHELAAQGCRSVGMICPLPKQCQDLDGAEHGHVRFHRRFRAMASKLGLECRDEWVLAPEQTSSLDGRSHEQYGRHSFSELWHQDQRPDGLFVTTDVVARGVTMAILEHQVRVPDELKLVYQRNDAIDLLCPFPVTFAVARVDDVAAALLQMVDDQYQGKTTRRQLLPIHLEANVLPE